MSKPLFSFGLKKGAPTSKGLPPPKKPAAAKFGGDDDDGSDDETSSGFDKLLPGKKKGKQTAQQSNQPKAVVEITELDGFEIEGASSTPHQDEDDLAAKKKKKKNLGGTSPPTKRLGASAADTKKLPPPPITGDTFGDLSSALESRKHAEAAAAQDPSIYDYDSVYDSFKLATHKKKSEQEAAEEKKPKYFGALQKAAEIRDRDRQIAEEKRLKRERDAEGDEFADKEKFVTEAYKKQQEENRRLAEEEKIREEKEAKENKNKGMGVFYKGMLEKKEQEHAAMVKAAEEMKNRTVEEREQMAKEEGEEKVKSATERAREINAKGGHVVINDDGEVVDKRELLKGGLNVAPKKKVEAQEAKKRAEGAAAHGGFGGVGQSKGVFTNGGKQAMRERQTRMLEAQLEETLKRSREEEDKEREKIELTAKSRKTEAEISSAKERYLARRRAAEEAKKNGAAQ
ncbi:coiled-coil domain-containing protein 55-domain containing protein [Rhypophila decipiens]|uniref:Coiled-coil domain-containing protein 55-domain containing protein n=1 Tax=Rhypophila decipiens TaxID=261697 RepID=A0AAN7BBN1_9PEZI|nr:coiled-coil domain-containing protein 55-domain containing protein [Rhypophila decipiens]